MQNAAVLISIYGVLAKIPSSIMYALSEGNQSISEEKDRRSYEPLRFKDVADIQLQHDFLAL